MVLDGQRARVDFALTPVAKKLINVNPNTISWVGLILALLCGVIFYLSGAADRTWLLVVGAVMVIVSGYFDALDGKVAKLSGKDAAARVLDTLRARYGAQGRAFELDGLSVEFDDWWFNVRCSNTEPLIRLNLEARSRALMESKRDEVLGVIRG